VNIQNVLFFSDKNKTILFVVSSNSQWIQLWIHSGNVFWRIYIQPARITVF